MGKIIKLFYVLLTIAAIFVLVSQSITHAEQLRTIGFILFTIFCIGLAAENRKSKAKLMSIVILYLFLGVGGYFYVIN